MLNFVNKEVDNNQYQMLKGFSQTFGNFSMSLKLNSASLNNSLYKENISYAALNIDLINDLTKIDKVLISAMERVPNSPHIRLANINIESKKPINLIAVQFSIKGNS